jgi:hypothetical protein
MKKIIVLLLLLSFNMFSKTTNRNGELFNKAIPKDSLSFTITPQDSNGIFNPKLTKTDLEEKFGKENIGEKSEWREEGTVEEKVTLLYPNSENEIKLTWKEEGTLATIVITKPNSQWNVNGLKVGISLAEIRELNSANFLFYGFGWDRGGLIYDWGTGKFAKTLENIEVSVELDWEIIGNQNIDKFMGDRVLLNSKETKLENLGITLYSIVIKY